MKPKKYLQRYREACDELESIAEERQRIVCALYNITSDPSGEGGGSGPKDKVGDGVATLVDHCKALDEEVKHYVAVRDEVRSVVREVMHESIILGRCLHYRYIMGWDPIVVAGQLNYSERQERNIHRKALDMVGAIIERRAKIAEDCRRLPL